MLCMVVPSPQGVRMQQSLKARAREWLERGGGIDICIAIASDYQHKDQFGALRLLMAYAYGSPAVERGDTHSNQQVVVIVGQPSPQQLEEARAALQPPELVEAVEFKVSSDVP